MKRSLTTLLATAVAALSFAAPAQAATVHAEGESTANGFHQTWAADWDDSTKDLTVTVTQVDLLAGGAPDSRPCDCGVVVTAPNGQDRTFTFDAALLNAGPVVMRNINAKSYLQRGGGSGLSYHDWYTPPAR